MAGDIVGGALVGGLVGGLVGSGFALYAKLTGKAVGRKQAPLRERPRTASVPATWKTETKRILIGLVWFVGIWFLARVVCGAIVGGIASSHLAAQVVGQAQGYAVGQRAAIEFFQQYGLLVLLGSLAAAVVGTITGVLPGTRRATRIVTPSGPPSEGQWPPPPSGAA